MFRNSNPIFSVRYLPSTGEWMIAGMLGYRMYSVKQYSRHDAIVAYKTQYKEEVGDILDAAFSNCF